MNDVLPLSEVRQACRQVLQTALTCIEYRALTRQALASLGYAVSAVNWTRQIEDVREKVLDAGCDGMFYMGKPLCIAGLRSWFTRQRSLFVHEDETLIIPGHARAGADGAFEALMRDPFMVAKAPHMAEAAALWRRDPERVARTPRLLTLMEVLKRTRADGLVLEMHVATWFRQQWPKFYQEKRNARHWLDWCSHDFRISTGERVWDVDVFGPDIHGRFKNPGFGKSATDLHFECETLGQDVRWRAVYTGKNYRNELLPWNAISPVRVVVWLNCLRDGLDYGDIAAFVNGK